MRGIRSQSTIKSMAFLTTLYPLWHLHLPLQSFPVCSAIRQALLNPPTPGLLFEEIYSPRRPKRLAPWILRPRMGAERRSLGSRNSLSQTDTLSQRQRVEKKRHQRRRNYPVAAFSSLTSHPCDVNSLSGHPISTSEKRHVALQRPSQSTKPLATSISICSYARDMIGTRQWGRAINKAATAIPSRRCFPRPLSTAD
jgi:hypothetical protein